MEAASFFVFVIARLRNNFNKKDTADSGKKLLKNCFKSTDKKYFIKIEGVLLVRKNNTLTFVIEFTNSGKTCLNFNSI